MIAKNVIATKVMELFMFFIMIGLCLFGKCFVPEISHLNILFGNRTRKNQVTFCIVVNSGESPRITDGKMNNLNGFLVDFDNDVTGITVSHLELQMTTRIQSFTSIPVNSLNFIPKSFVLSTPDFVTVL